MKTEQQVKILRAMKEFKKAVIAAYKVMGTSKSAEEALATLVHDALEGHQEWPTKVLQLTETTVPTDLENLTLLREMSEAGKRWREVRPVLRKRFQESGAPKSYAVHRLGIYRELFRLTPHKKSG